MAEGDVVRRRKGAGGKGVETADIDLPHRLAGAGAHGGQVAGGDDRQRRAQFRAARLGQGVELGVVALDGLLQRLALVIGALPGLALQHVTRPHEGNAAEQRAELAVAATQFQQLVGWRRADAGDHPGVQAGQQFAGLGQHRGGIMVAAEHHQAGAGSAQGDDEAVVQLAGVARRRGGVEDVSRHQHHVHLLLRHLVDQPGEKGAMLGLAGAPEEMLPQVPVGGVQQAQAAGGRSLAGAPGLGFFLGGGGQIEQREVFHGYRRSARQRAQYPLRGAGGKPPRALTGPACLVPEA